MRAKRAGLVPYRSVPFPNNKRPTCAVMKTSPHYLGKSMYDYPDLIIPAPPIEYGPNGSPIVAESDGPQLKDS